MLLKLFGIVSIILSVMAQGNNDNNRNGTFLTAIDFFNSRFVSTNIPLKPRLNDQRFSLKVCFQLAFLRTCFLSLKQKKQTNFNFDCLFLLPCHVG